MLAIRQRASGWWYAYPRDYRRFCNIIFLAGIGYGFVDLLVPLYGESLGVSNLTIGLLFAAFSLPKAVVAPFVGALSDKIGHRRDVVAVGFVVAGLLYIVVPVIGLITAFIVIRFLLGGVDAAIRPTARALISEVGGREGRGASFGLYSSFRTFGTVVGPVLAGFLIGSFGYVFSFGITGVTFIGAGLLTLLFVDPRFGPKAEELSPREALRSVGRAVRPTAFRVRSMVLVVLYLVVFLRFLGLHAYVRFLPLYLDQVGFTIALVGMLFSVRTLSAAVFFPFGGAASDRFGRLPILATGILLSGIAPFILFVIPVLPAVVVGLLIAGIGRALFIPTLPALISDLSPQTGRGTQLGSVSAVSSLAVGSAPLIAGVIGDTLELRFILIFSSGVMVLGAAICPFLSLITPDATTN